MDPTLAYAEEDAYLGTLRALIERESPTFDKPAADAFADHLEGVLAADGWTVTRYPQTEVGDHLEARWEAPGDTSSLILAHYDTVWPLGTLAAQPFRRDGDLVYGPGVLDMKAGIATSLFARRLIDRHGLAPRGPVTLLVTSDEEAGSLRSRELIERLARAHDRVFVVEPGRDDGALKVGRKGTGEFRLDFHGRSAHAGNNPDDGASALRELAHFVAYAEGLADREKATTVNVTVARAGTVSNVIAEHAHARVDMRVLELDEGERVERAVFGYAPRDPRVRVEVKGGLNRPPMEPTERNLALCAEADRLLAAMGLSLERAVVGGGSDGNFTSALGVPTLDGLGASGEGPHARHEHIRVRGTLERLALLTALLARPE